ncbi:MAG: thiamine biosynthesis protein ThiF [Pseudonocardiales bacterium]|nr:MAG: thiamine biosynthesis protein ThiF [Pseudonocardiales bacterium]
MPGKTTLDVMLSPAARLLWRAADVVQLELGGRAVLVEGLDPATVRRLFSPRPATADASAGPLDGTDDTSRHSLTSLTEAGYLWPRTDPAVGTGADGDARLAPPQPRLAAELAALTAQHGQRAAELLNARRHCVVAIHGAGRVAAHVAAVLASAGIGRVHLVDADDVRLHQATPGGLGPADEGRRFVTAANAAVQRAAPDTNTTPLPMGERPDLVVLAVDEPVDGDRRGALHARECAHLAVRLGADHGVVGPLVIPGLTSCLQCADLHRRDRDPAWTALAVQLTVARRHGAASDVALATVIAGIAALQALAFLDGGEPAVIEGTLELQLPDWRIRRRSWPVHPDCDCSGGATAQ